MGLMGVIRYFKWQIWKLLHFWISDIFPYFLLTLKELYRFVIYSANSCGKGNFGLEFDSRDY
jgi:hypothetical protein